MEMFRAPSMSIEYNHERSILAKDQSRNEDNVYARHIILITKKFVINIKIKNKINIEYDY